MVEVFKTNVTDRIHANFLTGQLHKNFIGYKVNFDLEDCDKILRIQYTGEVINTSEVIDLMEKFGFKAEVLPDAVELIISN